MSLDFWSKMKKIYHTGMAKIFRFGVKIFPMILWFHRVQDGLLKTFYQLRLGKQPKFLDFWSKMIPVGQNFRIGGQHIFDDFMVPNDKGRSTEDILSVETG